MVNVVMMSDVMLSPVFIAMLRVILLNFFMLSVVVPQENFSLMETLKNYNHKMFCNFCPRSCSRSPSSLRSPSFTRHSWMTSSVSIFRMDLTNTWMTNPLTTKPCMTRATKSWTICSTLWRRNHLGSRTLSLATPVCTRSQCYQTFFFIADKATAFAPCKPFQPVLIIMDKAICLP